RYPGYNGGEGDGIDLKAGLLNLTVRNNVIENNYGSGNGIVAEGDFTTLPARSNYLIEGNRTLDAVYPSAIALGALKGAIIRNNVMRKSLTISGEISDSNTYSSGVEMYNNTIYSGAISLGVTNGIKIRNNLIAGLDTSCGCNQLDQYNSTNIDSDYN